MARVLISFIAGVLAGGGVVFLIGTIGIAVVDPAPHWPDPKLDAYNLNYKTTVLPAMLAASAGAGLICGILCAMRAVNGSISGPVSAAIERPDWGNEGLLSTREFSQVLQTCLCIRLEEKEPAFVQGFLVGRLVEAHPGLASKLDSFSPRHVAALRQDLIDRQRL